MYTFYSTYKWVFCELRITVWWACAQTDMLSIWDHERQPLYWKLYSKIKNGRALFVSGGRLMGRRAGILIHWTLGIQAIVRIWSPATSDNMEKISGGLGFSRDFQDLWILHSHQYFLSWKLLGLEAQVPGSHHYGFTFQTNLHYMSCDPSPEEKIHTLLKYGVI